MSLKIKRNLKCRAFDIVVDDPRVHRHLDLMIEFEERGFMSPRGGSTGPHFKEGKRVGARLVFYLNEEVADEYLERMRRRVTKAEKRA